MAVTVNGIEIGDEAVSREVERIRVDYERYVVENGGEPDETQLQEWARENLIEKELLTQEARRSQEEPDEKKIQAYLEENRDVFDESLSEDARREIGITEMKIRSLVKSVRKNVRPPSEEDLRREYSDNIERFTVPESLRVSHICRVLGMGVDKSQVYLNLLDLGKKLKNHEIHWAEAIQESDTYSRDFGLFDTVMRGMLPMEVEEKLFALERGEVSDVIELNDTGTVHIFKVLVRREPEILPFDDVREDIATLLFNDAAENALNDLVDRLKESAQITL